MKKPFSKWMLILFLFQGTILWAQDQSVASYEKYGLDPLLYNGKYYTYFFPSGTKGTPFFVNSGYTSGTVQLHGQIFQNLSLNYDLLNQQVVLEYVSADNGIRHIILSDAWLESFELQNHRFEIVPDQDSIRHIYEAIGAGPIHVLYAWYKELKLDSRPGARSYYFTQPQRRMSLYIDHTGKKFTTNKSFVSLLPPGMQNRVKKYLSHHKINLRKASDLAIAELVSYLNTPVNK